MYKKKYFIKTQPDETSCGPSCLYSIYKMAGEQQLSFKKVQADIEQFKDGGGTLAVVLGIDALKKGYEVDLHTMNLNIFDPSWFHLSHQTIEKKLNARLQARKNRKKESFAIKKYLEFIQLGGTLKFGDVTPELLKKYLLQGAPLLVGLSSTWLYQCKRENPKTNEVDDITGDPEGHFILAFEYKKKSRTILIGDPYPSNPKKNPFYKVPIERFIASLYLGVYTYDANILIIKNRKNHEI